MPTINGNKESMRKLLAAGKNSLPENSAKNSGASNAKPKTMGTVKNIRNRK